MNDQRSKSLSVYPKSLSLSRRLCSRFTDLSVGFCCDRIKMPIDVAASAVGLALSVLYKYIEELIRQHMYEKAMEFNPLLEKIKIKLEALQPVIKEMEQKNRELDRPDELKDFTKVIEDGRSLVDKLKEVDRWYKKPKYTNKLIELDESDRVLPLSVVSIKEKKGKRHKIGK
ncbi:hypothetical protein ACLB2K_005928 [Fragaria x ananassa]